MTPYEVSLPGCRSEPLASYLKALGVLRVVAEQADPTAAGRWDPDGFVLESSLDEEGLESFLLHRYRPTPVVSPWNKSSGFGPEGAGELHVIEASNDDRLGIYRRAIRIARDILGRFSSKVEIVRACRSELPDECVSWIDAAVVLTPNGLAYPPLLGTGGNVGRLELSRNFHQRLLDVLVMAAGTTKAVKAARMSQAWLRDALEDLGQSAGVRESPGQFDPGAAGGTNSAASGKAAPVLNPWDYVLMLEGSMLFAAGAARRLGVGGTSRSAAPFCADAASVGYTGAAPDEAVKGEVWLPLWEQFASLSEVRRLMAEGRIDWRGRHARTGLDFAKAASSLGVDRGITAFGRYVLAERFGQAIVALPVGRVGVRSGDSVAASPGSPVLPLSELDPWLNRVRRGGSPPAGVRHALRQVDMASYRVTQSHPGALAETLVEVSRLEIAVGRARRFREESAAGPVSGPSARLWVPALLSEAGTTAWEDGAELRLAIALASCHDRGQGGPAVPASLRAMLGPVAFDERDRPQWTSTSRVEGLGVRSVVDVLVAAHVRRAVDVLAAHRRLGEDVRPDNGPDPGPGLPTGFARGRSAELLDVAALVAGTLDEDRLATLLAACMLLDWRQRVDVRWPGAAELGAHPVAIPPALAVLGPFYTRQPLTARWRNQAGRGTVPAPPDRLPPPVHLRPGPEWVPLLAAGRGQVVVGGALRRLRIAGLDPVATQSSEVGLDHRGARRLAAALLFPLSPRTGARLLRRSCPPDPEMPEVGRERPGEGPEDPQTEEVDDAEP
ncbi:MAG: type I-G CRISPR-associated protein Cas8g1/Csx17 [Acidimicrobiales bacterium]